MNDFNFNDLTPEQSKEISKAYSKSNISLSFLAVKFCVGLFASNLATMTLGTALLKEANPQIIIGYQLVTILLNTLFMSRYSAGKTNEIGDILKERISQILKK